MRNCVQLLATLAALVAFRKRKKDCNILKVTLGQGFCPLVTN